MKMMFLSFAPLYLWVETFSTAVYLMNRLSTSAFSFDTPFFKLYGKHPDYASLIVFSSKSFPYT